MTATAAPRLIAERADPRLPVTRLARLLDRDSATPLHPPDDCGFTAVAGRIDPADTRRRVAAALAEAAADRGHHGNIPL